MEHYNGQISDLSIHKNLFRVVTTQECSERTQQLQYRQKEVSERIRKSFRSTWVDAEDNNSKE
jgi:hypothetical protein